MSCKSVIVVGNGSGVLQKENGHLIDKFDCVIRLGSCKVKGYEKYIGTKTDIYCTHVDKFFNIDKESTTLVDTKFRIYPLDFLPTNILFVENDPDIYREIMGIGDVWGAEHIPNPSGAAGNIMLERMFKRTKYTTGVVGKPHYNNRIVYDFLKEYIVNTLFIKNILFYNKSQRAKVMALYNRHSQDGKISYLSNGMFALDYVFSNIRNSGVCVTGFDGFVTRHYCNQVYENFFKAHNSYKEKILYKKLLKQGKIYEL